MRSRWILVASVLVASLVLAGCSGSEDKKAAPRSAAPTPIGKLDTAAVRLTRSEFCDRVSAAAVRRALAGKAEADQHWGNGDPAPTGAGSSGDVTHELGCAWTGAAGAAARAWVFARPVDAGFAQSLVSQAGRQSGCQAGAASVFGSPALLQTCTQAGGIQRVRRAGLFGDTWLTCELAGPAGVRSRLDDWCAAVVAALDTR
jgi:hypothetical protein